MTFVSVLSCFQKIPSYIHGYVYNGNKPLSGIKIEDPYDHKIYAYTDRKGYFKINKLTKDEYLYIKKDNKKIDSIYYIRTHPERGSRYYFVEGRRDTLFIGNRQ